ncbi:MAG: type I-E CRISPR-associated protein Cse2/CasB [Deltaproteobacteria bacterium]|nr:type I-E CRISPR-associated protein Cse2/CasB [Deltaproteobacteria bacterium]
MADPSSDSNATSPFALTGRLAGALDQLAEHRPGDLAALRRMRLGDPPPAIFWRLCASHLDPAGMLPAGGDKLDIAERRWITLLAALAANQGLHQPDTRAGQGLAATLSETRFQRLLRAQDDALLDTLRGTALHLAAARQPLDWSQLVWLVLSDGRCDEDRARRCLARDFYAQLESLDRPRTE